MNLLSQILNPPSGLTLTEIVFISFILGMMHGATPDEHTWPITFSYAIGKYSTKSGMKAGFLFSAGFTLQRMLLTTLGFIGIAAFYQRYNLDGPIYNVVGIVTAKGCAVIDDCGTCTHSWLRVRCVRHDYNIRARTPSTIGTLRPTPRIILRPRHHEYANHFWSHVCKDSKNKKTRRGRS